MQAETLETPWIPAAEDEIQAVEDQLQRLLESHHFRHSQRYPALLRYVVERTLAGQMDQLKERLLGIAVFHRAPDYDSNADPVVRVTAGEVRKRIAQYYQEPANQYQIRISLPSGSYVPQFRPAPVPEGAAKAEGNLSTLETALPIDAVSESILKQLEVLATGAGSAAVSLPEAGVAVVAARGGVDRPRWWLIALILCAAVACGIAVGSFFLPMHPVPERGALDHFWKPLENTHNDATRPPLIIVGGHPAVLLSHIVPSATPSAYSLYTDGKSVDTFSVGDALSFARVASLLTQRGSGYQAASSARTTIEDFRNGPVVLFGAFGNTWTLRLSDALRYRFRMQEMPDGSKVAQIADARSTAPSPWAIKFPGDPSGVTQDYAIVARYFDTSIQQQVVIAAGILENGTTAAGEFVTTEHDLKRLQEIAPADWQHKNLELVLAVNVVDGRPGPPRIVASYFW